MHVSDITPSHPLWCPAEVLYETHRMGSRHALAAPWHDLDVHERAVWFGIAQQAKDLFGDQAEPDQVHAQPKYAKGQRVVWADLPDRIFTVHDSFRRSDGWHYWLNEAHPDVTYSEAELAPAEDDFVDCDEDCVDAVLNQHYHPRADKNWNRNPVGVAPGMNPEVEKIMALQREVTSAPAGQVRRHVDGSIAYRTTKPPDDDQAWLIVRSDGTTIGAGQVHVGEMDPLLRWTTLDDVDKEDDGPYPTQAQMDAEDAQDLYRLAAYLHEHCESTRLGGEDVVDWAIRLLGDSARPPEQPVVKRWCQESDCPNTTWGGTNRVHTLFNDCPQFAADDKVHLDGGKVAYTVVGRRRLRTDDGSGWHWEYLLPKGYGWVPAGRLTRATHDLSLASRPRPSVAKVMARRAFDEAAAAHARIDDLQNLLTTRDERPASMALQFDAVNRRARQHPHRREQDS